MHMKIYMHTCSIYIYTHILCHFLIHLLNTLQESTCQQSNFFLQRFIKNILGKLRQRNEAVLTEFIPGNCTYMLSSSRFRQRLRRSSATSTLFSPLHRMQFPYTSQACMLIQWTAYRTQYLSLAIICCPAVNASTTAYSPIQVNLVLKLPQLHLHQFV